MNSAAGASDRLRVDKWLWFARFFKTRALAGQAAGSGRLRINGVRAAKPAATVRPGDVLTFVQGSRVRVIRVEALGHRRGPAPEAQELYTDLEPPPSPAAPDPGEGTGASPVQRQEDTAAAVPADPPPSPQPPTRAPGQGRPTKRDRREIESLRRRGP